MRVAVVSKTGVHGATLVKPVTLWMELEGVGGFTGEEAQRMRKFLVLDEDGMIELKETDIEELVGLGWIEKCDDDDNELPHYHPTKGHTLDDVAKKFNLEMTPEMIVRRFKEVLKRNPEMLKEAVKAKGEMSTEMLELVRAFEKRQLTTTPDQILMANLGMYAITGNNNPLLTLKALPAIVDLVGMTMIEVARLKRQVAELEAKR
jgi:hypothetical protein